MKPLKRYRHLFSYITLFYLAMGISQYTQLLYFQKNGKLLNFSLAYSAMAIAGALSFLVANLLGTVSLRKVSRILGFVYAVGMILRIFYQSSWLAMISGGLSGLGAAILILVIRRWLYSEADKSPQNRQMLISSRYTLMQVTSLLATLITGLILFMFSARNFVYVTILVVAALAIVFLPTGTVPDDGGLKRERRQTVIVLPENRWLGLSYLGVVTFTGITTSIVEPIMPAILKATGYPISVVSVLMTFFGGVSIMAALLFQLPVFNKRPAYYFSIIELISGTIIVLSGLMTQDQAIWTLVAFLVMAIEGTGIFILKELIEYEMFPKKELVLYLGLAQSGFLVGDAIGAPLGTTLFQAAGGGWLLVLYGVMIVICGYAYRVLAKLFKRVKPL